MIERVLSHPSKNFYVAFIRHTPHLAGCSYSSTRVLGIKVSVKRRVEVSKALSSPCGQSHNLRSEATREPKRRLSVLRLVILGGAS